MRKKIIIASSGILLFFFVLTSFDTTEKYFEIARNLDIFATLYKEINTYYVDEVNPSKVMETGITAMLAELDPYTNYIPEDRIEDYRSSMTGQYGGIGANIKTQNGKVFVAMPFEGYAAHKAGLQVGDQIMAIDGVDVTPDNAEEITRLLRGQANSDVVLKIKRYGKTNLLDIPVKRQQIQLRNVPYYGMVTENVGLIQLTDFTRDAGKEVRDALKSLKEEGAEKIILDLRGNPGGLLTEAVNVSNVFVPKGRDIVSTKGRIAEWNKIYKSLDDPFDEEIPMAVLISSGSASASEIVAGVIQDYDRGLLIGENTFGKGLVQSTRSLSYNSKLKVTVAKYYIPSGRCIQAIDYSHRNDDGSVGRIPDSLRVPFKTRNGRLVYDGGGVRPDVEVEHPAPPPILRSLLNKGWIFDFANKYHAEHETIPNAKNFKLSDAEYNEFKAWLKDKDYDYTTKVEKMIRELRETAKDEAYYEALKGQINALEQGASHSKEADLNSFKIQIKEALESEIASRYYLQKGAIEASFDDDHDVLAAIEILNDKERYAKLIKP
ncbi:MAG: PDZ domain-containing protein [Bernardetiaceae bacterium]|nr:PDZ domain-containing protein [Bernardetiaceae bacterium]